MVHNTMKVRTRSTVIFLAYALVLAVVYVALFGDIPIYAVSNAVHDDMLMVEIADHIVGGPAYTPSILSKGWAFPLFLRIIHKLRLPYIYSMLGLNVCVSLLAVFALRRPRESFSVFHYVLYAALLFNPVMTSISVLQRVYRNGLSTLMAVVVIVSMIAVYLRRYEPIKTWTVWVAAASLALPLFWYSREDSIWLVPFMVGVVLVTTASALLCDRKRRAMALLAAMLVPVCALQGAGYIQRVRNEKIYGLPIVNELSEGEFPRVMRAIYAVDMDGPTYVAVSREKIRMLYDYSPALKSMQSALEIYLDAGSKHARLEENRINKEIENGWFFWYIRDAAMTKGFCDTLGEAQAFWKQMADELEAVLDSGALARRMTMPSALMPPWVEGTGERFVDALLEIPGFVTSFKESSAHAVISVDDGNQGIERFEKMTNSPALYSTEDEYYSRAVQAVGRQNTVSWVYQAIWSVISILGRVCFVAALVLLMISKNKSIFLREGIWMLAGLAGGLLVLYCGVGYNHAESCNSIVSLYLSSAYPLVILFDLLAVEVFCRGIICQKTEK